jgi:hypothetical protein
MVTPALMVTPLSPMVTPALMVTPPSPMVITPAHMVTPAPTYTLAPRTIPFPMNLTKDLKLR